MAQALPLLYQSMIAELYQAGGSGTIDVHGRVKLPSNRHGPERRLNGNAADWQQIMGEGLIAGDRVGEHRTAILTDKGRAEAERIIASRTRTAAA